MIFSLIRKHNFGVKIDDKMAGKARAGKGFLGYEYCLFSNICLLSLSDISTPL